jgi:hypothetical protein
MENVMTPAPTPLDLANYLEQLAAHVGYAVDWSELDPTLANQPDLVTAWVLAAAHHAGLAHARGLLAAPAAFLREQVGTGDFNDSTGCEVAMLFGLHEHHEHLEAEMNKATAAYAGCCQQLAATGLTSPTTAPGPVADIPTQASPPANGGT